MLNLLNYAERIETQGLNAYQNVNKVGGTVTCFVNNIITVKYSNTYSF